MFIIRSEEGDKNENMYMTMIQLPSCLKGNTLKKNVAAKENAEMFVTTGTKIVLVLVMRVIYSYLLHGQYNT